MKLEGIEKKVYDYMFQVSRLVFIWKDFFQTVVAVEYNFRKII